MVEQPTAVAVITRSAMAEYVTLATYKAAFTLKDADDGEFFNARWDFSPELTRPTKTHGGISGWAKVNDKLIRLHVCAQSPCAARWPVFTYFPNPVPRHGRLAEPVVTGGAESAGGAASTEAAAAPAATSPESMLPAIEALVGGRSRVSMSVGVAASCAKLREGISNVLKFSPRGKFRTF